MNLVLCGLPMSGKTTVGGLLSQKLNRDFKDVDRLIEEAHRRKTGKVLDCREIYNQDGEMAFRKMEKEQINNLHDSKQTVIALGGGSLTDIECRKIIQSMGCVIYLKSSPQILWKRVSDGGIPAYLDKEYPEAAFYKLAGSRVADYELAADIMVETDYLTAREIVDIILRGIHG